MRTDCPFREIFLTGAQLDYWARQSSSHNLTHINISHHEMAESVATFSPKRLDSFIKLDSCFSLLARLNDIRSNVLRTYTF